MTDLTAQAREIAGSLTKAQREAVLAIEGSALRADAGDERAMPWEHIAGADE